MSEAISQDDFTLLVASALSKAGFDSKSLHVDKSDFAIRCKDERGNVLSTIYLANMYVGYNNSTDQDQKDRVIRRAVALWSAPAQIETYEEARAKILPIIRERRFYPQEPTRSIEVGYPQIPISEHLTTILAVDSEDVIYPISNHDFERWQRSWDEIFDDAFANLKARRAMEWQVFESAEDPKDCAYILESEDDYGSSALVFPQMIAEFEVLGDPIVFAPARNIVVVTGSDCIFGLEHAADVIAQCENMQSALLPEMLSQDEDFNYFGCDLAVEHPLFETFNKIKLVSNYKVYTRFFQDLAGSFDILISSKRIVKYEVFEEGGAFFSEISFAAEEGPIILPLAENVRIIMPDREIVVSSETFADAAGDLLVNINEYPPVFELTAPLSTEQLEALTATS
jgi:hypothetical protein